MKKIAALLILFSCITYNSLITAQCSGMLEFNSQAEVNTFSGCTAFDGDISISGDDIFDLSVFSSLTSVSGYFYISYCPLLENLSGLENIASIGSGLALVGLPLIENIDELGALTHLGTQLVVLSNHNLITINGLENATGNLMQLYIADNPILQSFAPLSGLQYSPEAYIEIGSNHSLTSLDGLQSIEEVASFLILGNNGLPDLSGLENMTTAGYLVIVDNAALESLNGLSGLTGIGLNSFGLVIIDNEVLSDVSVLSNLENLPSIDVQDNPMLEVCCSFAGLLVGIPDVSRNIANNAPGCSDVIMVFENCEIPFCEGNFILSNQTEVNTFGDCVNLIGTLEISGEDITDLAPLNNLETVSGALVFSNNPVLSSLEGLSGIQSVGTLVVSGNPQLVNLAGLESLIQFETFICQINGNLENFDALQGVHGVVDYALITDCPSINSLDGFQNITRFEADLIIQGGSMTNLSGLNSLETVDNLTVAGCPLLTTLSGLESLKKVTGTLAVNGNEMLRNIEALSNLERVTTLSINGNTMLNECCAILPLVESESFYGTLQLSANNLECNSLELIQTDCNETNCEGDVIYLTSQAEVNAFTACEVVNGSLTIQGADITDLSPLSTVEVISGTLALNENSQLVSLAGLENIREIDGLVVINNPQLTDISAFSDQLNSPSELYVAGNTMLNNCCALVPLLTNNVIYTIENNGFGCNSLAEIYEACDVVVNIDLELSIETFYPLEEYLPLEITTFVVTLTNNSAVQSNDIAVNIPYLNNAGYTGTNAIDGTFENGTGIWHIPVLAPGSSATAYVSYWAPSDNSVFSLYAEVIAAGPEGDLDSTPANGNGISANEDDEALLSLDPFIYTGTPDLAFSYETLYFPNDDLYIGNVLPYELTLVNNGAALSGLTTGKAYFSADDVLDASDALIAEFDIRVLGPGHAEFIEVNTLLPEGTLPGSYFIITSLDDGNLVAELDEVNNILAKPVEVIAPDADSAIDLQLDLSVNVSDYIIYQYITYTLNVINNSTREANDVVIDFQIPEGLAFVENNQSIGFYYNWVGAWNIFRVNPGATETLELVLYSISDELPINSFAQVVSAEQYDTDSTPNNADGENVTEDDEALVTIVPFGFDNLDNFDNENTETRNAVIASDELRWEMNAKVFPNPAIDYIELSWLEEEASEALLKIADISGKIVYSKKISTVLGENIRKINLSGLKSGIFALVLQSKHKTYTTTLIVDDVR